MTGVRILIVTAGEGGPLAPELLGALTAAGHDVTIRPHGPEALVALASAAPDLVVAEVGDVRREGHAFAAIIRERPSFEDLPLVAVADVLLRDHAALLGAGFDRVVPVATADRAVPRACQDLVGTEARVPHVLEAVSRAAAIALREHPRLRHRTIAASMN
jgi:hypothetical protein